RSDVILYALLVLEEGLVEQRRQIVPGPHFDRHSTAVEGNLLACRQLRDHGERWLAAGDHQPFNKIGSRGCKDLGNGSTHGVTHEMGVVDAKLRAQLEPVPGQHLQSIGPSGTLLWPQPRLSKTVTRNSFSRRLVSHMP
ncbi:MAG: hypothetical protein R6U00_11660, partial [Prochlorococcaceae cyanobacterium]